MKTQDYFREFVTIVFIRWPIIVGILLIFVVASLLVAVLWPPVFQASGEILVKQNKALTQPTSVEDTQTDVTYLREEDIHSEMQIIISPSVADRTVTALHEQGFFGNDEPMDKKRQRTLANRITQNLSARLMPTSNVIQVHLKWGGHTDCEKILDVYFQEYLDYRSSLFNPKEAVDFFLTQFRAYDKELREREERLIQLAEAAHVSDPRAQINSNLAIQQDLETELTALQNEQTRKQELIQQLRESLAKQDIQFFTAVDVLQLARFAEQLQTLMMEKQDLLSLYTDESPKIGAVNRKIEEASEALKAEVQSHINVLQAELTGIKRNIEVVRARMGDLDSRNMEMRKNLIQSQRIDREISLLEDSYRTFAKRLEEAQIKSEANTDQLFSVSILTHPRAEPTPVFPRRRQVIVVGSLIGLVLGCTVGFLLEFFDHTFKRPEDVQNYTDLPPIFSIGR